MGPPRLRRPSASDPTNRNDAAATRSAQMTPSARLLVAAAGIAFLSIVLWMWSGHLSAQQRLIRTAERCCALANQRKYWDAARSFSPDLKARIETHTGGLPAALRFAAEMDHTDNASYRVGRLIRWEPENGVAVLEILRRTARARRPDAIAVPWLRRGARWEVAPALLDDLQWNWE